MFGQDADGCMRTFQENMNRATSRFVQDKYEACMNALDELTNSYGEEVLETYHSPGVSMNTDLSWAREQANQNFAAISALAGIGRLVAGAISALWTAAQLLQANNQMYEAIWRAEELYGERINSAQYGYCQCLRANRAVLV